MHDNGETPAYLRGARPLPDWAAELLARADDAGLSVPRAARRRIAAEIRAACARVRAARARRDGRAA